MLSRIHLGPAGQLPLQPVLTGKRISALPGTGPGTITGRRSPPPPAGPRFRRADNGQALCARHRMPLSRPSRRLLGQRNSPRFRRAEIKTLRPRFRRVENMAGPCAALPPSHRMGHGLPPSRCRPGLWSHGTSRFAGARRRRPVGPGCRLASRIPTFRATYNIYIYNGYTYMYMVPAPQTPRSEEWA